MDHPSIRHGYQVRPQNFEVLNNIFQNHPLFAESFQLKQLEFLNNFLNAVADLHQKLESDLFELGVIEIDDILLKRDHFLISDECQQLYSESRSETPDASVESSWQTMDGFEKCLRPQNFEGDPGIYD
ncbi:hypothetical protein Goshw_008968 [Gossypium schwendimanii]|uniref:Uncharacterized protein n=1 Tax=Gossypium schwendimanii TaxID=34291 RepID=A0A7J9MN95_GOSSC|nr:hypothetical protein [Gossypium schwendimanii]